MLDRLVKNGVTVAGLAVLLTIGLIAVFAPWISPHDAWAHQQPFGGPSWLHPLGTNDVGQDILSELFLGSRVSLAVGLSSATIAVGLGALVGLVAGFRGGSLDDILTGSADVFLVLPMLPLVILVSSYLGSSTRNTALIIGLLLWPSTARVVRSQVLSVRESGFVQAVRAMGSGHWWTMRYHVFPHVFPVILAKFVLTVAAAMGIEASLSFVGLGDPFAKSWGTMLHYAFARGGFVRQAWWWFMPPGLCIGACVFSLMLVSMGLERRADPRLARVLDH